MWEEVQAKRLVPVWILNITNNKAQEGRKV